MHFSSGVNPNEIGDFEVVAAPDGLHLFYLALPSHDQVGHLHSADGFRWRELPPAIRTGAPGAIDSDCIFTMGIFRCGERWHMLYTALSDQDRQQRIALAVSDDLLVWEKYGNQPVIEADSRWYEVDEARVGKVHWRDPHIIRHAGRYHAYICARANTGPQNRRGCAAYCTSTDGIEWEVHPPVAVAGQCFDYECPSVFQLESRWYMVAIAGGTRRSAYRLAASPSGPFTRPADDTLLPGLNLSARPSKLNGELHLWHWQRGTRDWGKMAGSAYAMVASPKRVTADQDGNLYLSIADWRPLFEGAPVTAPTWQPLWGNWSICHNGLRVATDSAALAQIEAVPGHFQYTMTIQPDATRPAREFGCFVHGGDKGDSGIFVGLIPGQQRVELVLYRLGLLPAGSGIGRGREVIQSASLPPAENGTYHLRIIVYGPQLEVEINDKLVLAQCTRPREDGAAGCFAEDGAALFSDHCLHPLTPPTCPWW